MDNVDFVAWDNSDPPQLWAWAGEYGDETAEPLFRLPADELLAEWQEKDAEIERFRKRSQTSDDQLVWLAKWCYDRFGVKNNDVIANDDWPNRLVEVVAKTVDEKINRLQEGES